MNVVNRRMGIWSAVPENAAAKRRHAGEFQEVLQVTISAFQLYNQINIFNFE